MNTKGIKTRKRGRDNKRERQHEDHITWEPELLRTKWVFWKAPQARRRCPQSNNLKIAKTQRKTKTTQRTHQELALLKTKWVFWKAPQLGIRSNTKKTSWRLQRWKKHQNHMENAVRAWFFENKVSVLKSSSVKNKVTAKQRFGRLQRQEETPKQHGQHINESLIFWEQIGYWITQA